MNATRIFAVLLLPLAGLAQAGEMKELRQEHELRANARIVVRNVAGHVHVAGGTGTRLQLTGMIEEGAEAKVSGSPSDLRIEVPQPDDDEALEAELHLQVPAGVELDIETVSADVIVRGTRGEVAARTVSGEVRVETESPEVVARSVSGDVTVHAPSTDTEAKTISGDVDVKGVRGELAAESVSGDLSVEMRAARDVRVQSVSGDLFLKVQLEERGTLSGETMSGDVIATLPEQTSAELTASTFSGEASSELPAGAASKGESLKLKLGGGKGRIELQSFSGDVRVRRQP